MKNIYTLLVIPFLGHGLDSSYERRNHAHIFYCNIHDNYRNA